MQTMVDVGRREGGLRREGIFHYFLCSIYPLFVFLPTPTGHNRRPITTVCSLKCVFPRKVGPFGGLGDKKIMLGVKTPQKHDFGGLNKPE